MTANWKRLLRVCVRVEASTMESEVPLLLLLSPASLTGLSLLPRTSVAASRGQQTPDDSDRLPRRC